MLKLFGKLLFQPSSYVVQGNQTAAPLVRSLQVVSNFAVDYWVGRLGHGDFHRKFYSLASSAGGLSGSVLQKGNKMHQTKIGNFFKKSVGGETPVKKKEDEDEKEDKKPKREVKEEVVEAKTTMKGRKRKSARSSSSDPEEEDDDSKKRKKNGLKVKLSLTKKPRRRIVVASDSDEEAEKKDTKPLKKASEKEEDLSEKSDEEDVDEKPVKKQGKKSVSPKDKKSTKKVEKKERSSSPEKEKASRKEEDLSEKSDVDVEEKPVKKQGKNSVSAKDKKSTKKVEKKERSSSPEKEKASLKEEDLSEKSDEEDVDEKPVKKQEKKSVSPKGKKSTKKVEKKERSSSPEKEKTSPKEEEKQEESPQKKTTMTMMGGGANPKGWNAGYEPSKAKYDPIADATWKRGEKVPYLALAKTLEVIEATSSRLKFIEILANYFRSVILLSPDDLRFSVYLCLNKLAPAYEGIELGVAETNVMKAIAQATGRALDKIKADAGQLGDLGLVAESSRSNQKTLFQPQPLTVSGVFHKLKEICAMTGQASHGKKISMITSMLVACKHSEARYLTRSLLGKLRIGLAEQSLLQALAQATYLTPPNQDMSEWPPKILNAGKKMSAESLKTAIEEHAFIVKSSFCECPNYDILVKAMLEVGIDGLQERCKLTPGIPPRPMLAQPTKGVADVLQRFEGIRFTCEYKYDGERAQIHLSDDGVINIYSRNQENNTSKYPDIISRFSQCIKGNIKSCIIDAEAVAWDLEKGGILPFQVLSTRKRKDANESEIKVQVCIFAFDLIYLNGESLVKEPLFKRRELLRENFQVVEGQFLFATSVDTDSMEVVQEFLEESLKGNCEGLMVKTLDERATYELAKRSQKWLKLKKDYLDSGGDSLDLVVIGGFFGKGKRTGTYGGFLLACYDPDEEAFQTICKIGTGFSDEQLQQHSESLKPNIIPNAKSYYRFHNNLTPDHWFDAVQVWEVKCADLSLSPVHKAGEGLVDPERGISLRFPRFLRLREDKNVEDATSSRQVADMYNNQEQVKNMNGNGKGAADEDEFY